MDLIRKYLLSSVARQAPEAPAAAPGAEPPPPAPAAAADPAGDPPEPPAADLEPDPGPEPEPPAHGNKGKTPWYMTRISEESARAQRAERRAADAEAMLERMQGAGATPAAGDPPAAPATPRAPAQPTQQEFEAAVQREVDARHMFRETTNIRSAGLSTYPDFGQSLDILTAVGATADEFVLDVLAVDRGNAHKIYHELAQDPERAGVLARMSSRDRIAELTRMSMTATAPAAPAAADPKPAAKPAAVAAPKVSRAPAPPPAVEPSAAPQKDWRADDSSEEEFQRGWEDMMKRRRAARG